MCMCFFLVSVTSLLLSLCDLVSVITLLSGVKDILISVELPSKLQVQKNKCYLLMSQV